MIIQFLYEANSVNSATSDNCFLPVNRAITVMFTKIVITNVEAEYGTTVVKS
jgi:hypothetical protein